MAKILPGDEGYTSLTFLRTQVALTHKRRLENGAG